jgi:hypothetical protein
VTAASPSEASSNLVIPIICSILSMARNLCRAGLTDVYSTGWKVNGGCVRRACDKLPPANFFWRLIAALPSGSWRDDNLYQGH